jgi:hypothetical protein
MEAEPASMKAGLWARQRSVKELSEDRLEQAKASAFAQAQELHVSRMSFED